MRVNDELVKDPIPINLNKKEWEGRLHIESYFSGLEGKRFFTYAVFLYRDGKPHYEFMGSLSKKYIAGGRYPHGIPDVDQALKAEIGVELTEILEDAFKYIEQEATKLIIFPKGMFRC